MTLTRWSMSLTIAPGTWRRNWKKRTRVAPIASTMWPSRQPPRPRVIFLGGADLEYIEREPGPEPRAVGAGVLAVCAASARRRCGCCPMGAWTSSTATSSGSLTSVIVADMQPGEEAIGVRLRPGAFIRVVRRAGRRVERRVCAPRELIRRPPTLRRGRRGRRSPRSARRGAMYQRMSRRCLEDSGYSARHLRRRVLAATGHSPRKLARIVGCRPCWRPAGARAGRGPPREFGYYDEVPHDQRHPGPRRRDPADPAERAWREFGGATWRPRHNLNRRSLGGDALRELDEPVREAPFVVVPAKT